MSSSYGYQQGRSPDRSGGDGGVPGSLPAALSARLIAHIRAGDVKSAFAALPKKPDFAELGDLRSAARGITKELTKTLDSGGAVNPEVVDFLVQLGQTLTHKLDPHYLQSTEAELYFDQHQHIFTTALRIARHDRSAAGPNRELSVRESLIKLYVESEEYRQAELAIDGALELTKKIADCGARALRSLSPLAARLRIRKESKDVTELLSEGSELARALVLIDRASLRRADHQVVQDAASALHEFVWELPVSIPDGDPEACFDEQEYREYFCAGEIYAAVGEAEDCKEHIEFGLKLLALDQRPSTPREDRLLAHTALLAGRAIAGDSPDRLLSLGFDVRDSYLAAGQDAPKRYAMEVLTKFLPSVANGVRHDEKGGKDD